MKHNTNYTIYIYIEKIPNGAFRISGFDEKNNKSLYDYTFYDFTKCEALAAFREHYNIKHRHAYIADLTKG